MLTYNEKQVFKSRLFDAILVLLIVAGLFVAGCSGLQATNEMKQVIAQNAAFAASDTNPTAETAKAGITRNAAIFTEYYEAATVNVFAYWFDPAKTIYCNGKFYNLFHKMCVVGELYKIKVENGEYADSVVIDLYGEEKKWVRQVHDGMQGKEVAR